MLKTLKDFDVKNKRVLVRCDFNVPLDEKGLILDDFRIRQSLATIKYLIEKGAKLILMSHLDKPGGKIVEKLKFDKIKEKLAEYLPETTVIKVEDCISKEIEEMSRKIKPGDILLLENLRFHKEEEANVDSFAKELSKLGEIYINDAFGTCHRAHASIVGIPKYLPSGIGFLLKKEIEVLSKVLENPYHPLVVIIGGVKISTKIKVINKFLEIADHLILGSKLAETILIVKGILVGRKLPEKDISEEIEKIELTDRKLHLPPDVVMSLPSLDERYIRIGAIGTARKDEEIYDIGPEAIKIFSEIIKGANMIVWNGPVGYFEKSQFREGTKKIVYSICRNYKAFKVAGGGETDLYLYQSKLREKFNHVSTGGGAMLKFLGGEKLSGIEALK